MHFLPTGVERICLSVCQRSKRQTAWAITAKLGTYILYISRSACIDPEVKGQGHTVTKTVTVARLLVMRAATAVCCCCRRGSACRYDCLCSLVSSYWRVLLFTYASDNCDRMSRTEHDFWLRSLLAVWQPMSNVKFAEIESILWVTGYIACWQKMANGQAREISNCLLIFPWNLSHFQKSTVKQHFFPCECPVGS